MNPTLSKALTNALDYREWVNYMLLGTKGLSEGIWMGMKFYSKKVYLSGEAWKGRE